MSESVDVHEAEAHLSQLLDRAAAGEEIVITRAGRPAVRLVAVAGTPRRKRREPGAWRGQVSASADFDDLPALDGPGWTDG